jgi:hypothetical protein
MPLYLNPSKISLSKVSLVRWDGLDMQSITHQFRLLLLYKLIMTGTTTHAVSCLYLTQARYPLSGGVSLALGTKTTTTTTERWKRTVTS